MDAVEVHDEGVHIEGLYRRFVEFRDTDRVLEVVEAVDFWCGPRWDLDRTEGSEEPVAGFEETFGVHCVERAGFAHLRGAVLAAWTVSDLVADRGDVAVRGAGPKEAVIFYGRECDVCRFRFDSGNGRLEVFWADERRGALHEHGDCWALAAGFEDFERVQDGGFARCGVAGEGRRAFDDAGSAAAGFVGDAWVVG